MKEEFFCAPFLRKSFMHAPLLNNQQHQEKKKEYYEYYE
tara:strand:+ start:208 stop:324 length:117 start_codon:yes stop_codon:yes gene_type:complete